MARVVLMFIHLWYGVDSFWNHPLNEGPQLYDLEPITIICANVLNNFELFCSHMQVGLSKFNSASLNLCTQDLVLGDGTVILDTVKSELKMCLNIPTGRNWEKLGDQWTVGPFMYSTKESNSRLLTTIKTQDRN